MDYTSFAPGNNSINKSVPPPAPQYSMPGGKHLPKLVTLIVLFSALGLAAYAGVLYWQNQQLGEDYAVSFTPRPSTTPDPTAGWKTYTNTQYGFEFKYPTGWSTTVGDNKTSLNVAMYNPNTKAGLYGRTPEMMILVTPNIDLNSYLAKKRADRSLVNEQSITFLGRNAIEATDLGIVNFYSIFFEEKNAVFQILTGSETKANVPVEERELISTFKFTK